MKAYSLVNGLRTHIETFGLPFDIVINPPNPGVAVTKVTSGSPFEQLADGELDLCVTFVPDSMEREGVECEPLYRGPILLYVAAGQGFYDDQRIDLAVLKDHFFVSPKGWEHLIPKIAGLCEEESFYA